MLIVKICKIIGVPDIKGDLTSSPNLVTNAKQDNVVTLIPSSIITDLKILMNKSMF